MTNPLLRDVRLDERLRFLRDGVVCLRQIVAPEWVRRVQQDDGIVHEQLMFESGAGEVARQLTVARRLRWLRDQLFYADAGADPVAGPVGANPWHQDTSFGLADSQRIVRMWVPVDHMPRERAIEVVRGSHLWKVEQGWTSRVEVHDIEANRRAFDIVGYEVDPGDVVVFNYRALHHAGGGSNSSSSASERKRRSAFAILCADDELALRHRLAPPFVPSQAAGLA